LRHFFFNIYTCREGVPVSGVDTDPTPISPFRYHATKPAFGAVSANKATETRGGYVQFSPALKGESWRSL